MTGQAGVAMARRVPDGDETGCRKGSLDRHHWGEQIEGTNGVGTCLVDGAP